jgi:hypothetical protein
VLAQSAKYAENRLCSMRTLENHFFFDEQNKTGLQPTLTRDCFLPVTQQCRLVSVAAMPIFNGSTTFARPWQYQIYINGNATGVTAVAPAIPIGQGPLTAANAYALFPTTQAGLPCAGDIISVSVTTQNSAVENNITLTIYFQLIFATSLTCHM